MAKKFKKPPVKETVGALYYVFNVPEEGSNAFTTTYESDVNTSAVVKTITTTETGDTTDIKASGETYDTVSDTTSIDQAVEVVAFDSTDIAKMRGEIISTLGLIVKGGSKIKPYFAFGKVVKLSGGNYKWIWYPKCKLVSNSDDIATKEESFSEQNDTLTIRAYPFNDDGEIEVCIDSTVKVPAGLTEDLFFSKPILKDDDLIAVIGN